LSYKKGVEVLPAHLLKEIQKYVDGSFIYIPKISKKAGWGCLSGARKSLAERNNKILELFQEGLSIGKLAEDFYLSEETIKKIVYGKK
jgi:DNA-binding NarL/FixJ family response regulator